MVITEHCPCCPRKRGHDEDSFCCPGLKSPATAVGSDSQNRDRSRTWGRGIFRTCERPGDVTIGFAAARARDQEGASASAGDVAAVQRTAL